MDKFHIGKVFHPSCYIHTHLGEHRLWQILWIKSMWIKCVYVYQCVCGGGEGGEKA